MACIVMAQTLPCRQRGHHHSSQYILMACIVMACIVMAQTLPCRQRGHHHAPRLRLHWLWLRRIARWAASRRRAREFLHRKKNPPTIQLCKTISVLEFGWICQEVPRPTDACNTRPQKIAMRFFLRPRCFNFVAEIAFGQIIPRLCVRGIYRCAVFPGAY